ncbi:hypothetical protein COB64_04445 [Candidatus Wolfebacteria bacterium]|nr:MAG: hypothetical protein COB64_04445 [Candidatus Wolfebacteria bacterium]
MKKNTQQNFFLGKESTFYYGVALAFAYSTAFMLIDYYFVLPGSQSDKIVMQFGFTCIVTVLMLNIYGVGHHIKNLINSGSSTSDKDDLDLETLHVIMMSSTSNSDRREGAMEKILEMDDIPEYILRDILDLATDSTHIYNKALDRILLVRKLKK